MASCGLAGAADDALALAACASLFEVSANNEATHAKKSKDSAFADAALAIGANMARVKTRAIFFIGSSKRDKC